MFNRTRTFRNSVMCAFSAIIIIVTVVGCARDYNGLHHGSSPSFNRQTGDLVLSVRKDGNGRLLRMKPSGTIEFLAHDGDSFDPKVANDGARIVFAKATDQDRSDIWIMDADGRNPRQLTSGTGRSSSPVLLGSGLSVVFARASRLRQTSTGGSRWVDWDLYEVPQQGGAERRLTYRAFRDISDVELLNGGRFALIGSEDRESPPHLVLVDLANGETRSFGMPGELGVAVAPKSGNVAFRRNIGDYNYEIFVMEPTGHRRQITTLNSYTWAPVFSPDERRIIFLSDPTRKRLFQLWEVGTDGRNARQILIPELN